MLYPPEGPAAVPEGEYAGEGDWTSKLARRSTMMLVPSKTAATMKKRATMRGTRQRVRLWPKGSIL